MAKAFTPAVDAKGFMVCEKCGSGMVPMANGKGFRCGVQGNRWDGSGWSKCSFVVWNNSKPGSIFSKPSVPRATSFPIIKFPTTEQVCLFDTMGMTPSQRGGRLIITDAGPGTAKTTTISWGTLNLKRRLGHLSRFPLMAFNGNARDTLMGKLPIDVPDIFTINGWHAQAQGYRYQQYDKKKVYGLFKLAVAGLPKDEKPNFGQIGKVIERMRDICLYNDDAGDKQWWNEAIATTLERFPSLAKKCASKAVMEAVMTYVPMLATQAHTLRNTIDIQEQVTRPMSEACRVSKFRMRFDCCSKPACDWTDDDVTHFAKLIRAISLPEVRGMVVDEGQDLSLCQVATILAQTWRSSELIVIGDDCCGKPTDDNYKAGQGIYGWRGAFPGVLTLLRRLWVELTGERAVETQLTTTFRHSQETCESYRRLNKTIRSGLPAGSSQVWQVTGTQAFAAWLALPVGKTGLWITRTNAPLADLLKETIKEGEECCIRGGADLTAQIDGVLSQCAGWYDNSGEFKTSLSDAMKNLEVILAEMAEADDDSAAEVDPNSLEQFTLEIMQIIAEQPELLRKAQLEACATVGNVRRFIEFFATRTARRVLTTVYRCKGDEADLSIVGDIEKFNSSWGDEHEDAACRHVAASRGKEMTLHCGVLSGCDAKRAPLEMFSGDAEVDPVVRVVTVTPIMLPPATARIAIDAVKETPALPPAKPKATRKPRKPKSKPE